MCVCVCGGGGGSLTTTLRPMMEFAPQRGSCVSVISTVASPAAFALMLPRSPACLSSSLGQPCFFPAGLKWGPALTQPARRKTLTLQYFSSDVSNKLFFTRGIVAKMMDMEAVVTFCQPSHRSSNPSCRFLERKKQRVESHFELTRTVVTSHPRFLHEADSTLDRAFQHAHSIHLRHC